jgi:large subunit ribosomal protein L10
LPSKKVLEKKAQQVDELADKISKSVAGIIVDYKGINVADDTKLRKELREAGVDYSVVKNTLLKRAADKAGLSGIDDVLSGTTAIALSSEDRVAPARILGKYAKRVETFNIKTGYLDGAVIDDATIKTLASLPSREVLLATVCNVFNAPISAFARAIQAVADKKQSESGAAAPAAE